MFKYRKARIAVVALLAIGLAAAPALTAGAQAAVVQAPAVAAVSAAAPAIWPFPDTCGGASFGPPGVGINWGPLNLSNCSHFGRVGATQGYTWYVPFWNRSSACVQVKGFIPGRTGAGAVQMYSGGCGRSGSVTVPWGNNLARPGLRAASLGVVGTQVNWNS